MDETQEATREYWKGRYDESVAARKELEELIKNTLGQVHVQDKGPESGNSLTNPLTSQMGAIIGAFPSLLMVLFGIYGTGTGADIGIPMIIIGAIFSLFVVPFLLARRRNEKSKKGKSEDESSK